MTIEERAKEYASKHGDISLSAIYNEALANIYEEAYMAGAIEQKAIDDAECVNQVLMGKGSAINYYKQGFHDAIDKAFEYANAKYDLDYCGNVRDVLNYLKSLVRNSYEHLLGRI